MKNAIAREPCFGRVFASPIGLPKPTINHHFPLKMRDKSHRGGAIMFAVGQSVLTRSGAWLAFIVSIGVVACVSLDKPKELVACAANNSCSGTSTGGASGAISAAGGTAGSSTGTSSTGGAAGASTTTGPGAGGAGAGAGGSIAAGGTVASGGVATDAPADTPFGGAGGATGAGGRSTTGGATGTGGTAKNGGATGAGGATPTGGTTATGGVSGTGGAKTPDAGPDAQPDASPLLTGLVAYYTFESATGTTLPDSSGKGNDGKLGIGILPDGGAPGSAGYEFVTGKVGKALTMHKAGLGYVSVPTAVFANTTDITIAVWVNVTTSQSWQRVLDVGINAKIAKNTQTGTKYLNIVPKNDGSNMLVSISTNGYGSEQQLSAPSLATSTWIHMAVVLASGGVGRLYVNGAEANSNTSLALRPSDLGAIDYAFIGKSQFSADPAFDGIVDEFRVYNRALSAAEILTLYNFTGS